MLFLPDASHFAASTNGHKAYLTSVSNSLGDNVDCAMLVNLTARAPSAGSVTS